MPYLPKHIFPTFPFMRLFRGLKFPVPFACRARCRNAAAERPRTPFPAQKRCRPCEQPRRAPCPAQERSRRAPPAPFPAQKLQPPCAPRHVWRKNAAAVRTNLAAQARPAQKHCRRAPRAQTKIPPRTRPGGKSKRNARYFLIQLPLAARATRPCCWAYSSARENSDDTDDANRV